MKRMDMDSTNSHNTINSSSMNARIIFHRQGHYNYDNSNGSNNISNNSNNSNSNIEEVTVEEDRYWFSSSSSSSSSSSASISCLSLSLVSRLIKRFFAAIGRVGSSLLFFWLALICGLLTLSNVQHSFRTIIETETRVMVNRNMNGNNANIAAVAQQQGRLFNRTNKNITTAPPTPPILPKTKIIYYPTILPTTNSNDSSPVNAATAAATTIATTTEHNKDENNEPPLPSSSTIRLIDPTSLKRGIDLFLRSRNYYDTTTTTDNKSSSNYIWDLLENYQTYHTHTHTHHNRTTTHNHNHNHSNNNDDYYYYYEQDEISSEMICGIGPGRGMEQDAGYKLLVEKVRIMVDIDEPTTTTNNNDDMPNDNSSSESQQQQPQQQHEPPAPPNPKPKPNPKILCLVYTYSPMRYLVRTQAIVWGRQCDGYIAFSNETIPELGIYQLPTNNEYSGVEEESYTNMWQKTRRIWKYVHDHFVEDYDYFYISGDDVYLLVNNFRSYIQNELELLVSDSDSVSVPRHFGSWLPSKSMIAGGPGYTLNKAALQQFFEITITTTTTTTVNGKGSSSSSSNTSAIWNNCLSNKHASYEDRFMSYCMSTFLGIHGNDTDTRDPTGEQKFHDTDPATLYLFRSSNNKKGGSSSYFSRMASSWEDQPMPQQQKQQQPPPQNHIEQVVVVGPKHGLDSAAKYSISLHRIYTPTYMARIHAILHHHPTTSTSTSRAICPIDTPLGKGLQRHYLH